MSSFDQPGACPEPSRSPPAASLSPAAAKQPRTLSLVEALQGLLDAAEQRNAEDSPSGIARQSSFGLTG